MLKRCTGFSALVLVAASFCSMVRAGAEDIVPRNAQSSIDRGLQWLAAQQRADGSYLSTNGSGVAITSLSLMAFMARGHTPGQGPYGDQINKGIDWVLSCQAADGLIASGGLGHSMYEHGISTVMLGEAYGMVDAGRQEKIQHALAGAVRVILNAQNVNKSGDAAGGWRYTPNSSDSDMSVTGWQLMALRGAANAGAAVPEKALRDGVGYIAGLANVGGGFGYMSPNEVTPARTGTGVLAMELLGHHLAPQAISGGDYLLRHPVNNAHVVFYYYAVYYVSQAANQLGGKHWPGIYAPLRDGLISCQNADGSWSSSAGMEDSNAYCTAMAVLGLCVPYRYLPLYQR